jgi:hypothetical protein
MNPVEVEWPPVLTTVGSGQRYAISGGTWIPVSADTTFDDLSKYMVVKRRESPSDGSQGSWQVEGSKGAIYTVKAVSGDFTCTCPGFGWRRKCKHIENIKKEV